MTMSYRIVLPLFLIVTAVGFAPSPGEAQTLDTSTLDTGGLSTGSAATNAQPVRDSKILKSTYSIQKGSASDFLATEILKLEAVVSGYDALPAKDQALRDAEIRRLVSNALDLDHLAKRALAAYWDKLGATPAGKKERSRYAALFKNLVEENYLEKARTYMNGKYQIPLVKEKEQRGIQIVEAKILKSDVDMLVAFKIKALAKSFKIVDVRLDETSLEGSYRSSFNRIIRKKGGLEEGMPELLRVMEKRLQELRTGEATRL